MKIVMRTLILLYGGLMLTACSFSDAMFSSAKKQNRADDIGYYEEETRSRSDGNYQVTAPANNDPTSESTSHRPEIKSSVSDVIEKNDSPSVPQPSFPKLLPQTPSSTAADKKS